MLKPHVNRNLHIMIISFSLLLLTFYSFQIVTAAEPIEVIDWSSTGNQAIGYGLGTVKVFNSTGQQIKELASESQIVALTWSPDGRYLAYTNHFSDIKVWDSTNDQITDIQSNDQYSNSLNWSPNSNLLGIGSQNGSGSGTSSRVQIWDISLVQLSQTIETYSSGFEINSITWNPIDANQLAVSSVSGEIKIWDISTSSELKFLAVAENALVTAIDWSKDGTQLAAASTDGSIWIWNTTTWQSTIITVSDTVADIKWSGDGRLAIANFKSAKVIDPNTEQVLQTYQYTNILSTVAWSPDDTQLVFGGVDGTVQTVNVPENPPPTSTPPPSGAGEQGCLGSSSTSNWNTTTIRLARPSGCRGAVPANRSRLCHKIGCSPTAKSCCSGTRPGIMRFSS